VQGLEVPQPLPDKKHLGIAEQPTTRTWWGEKGRIYAVPNAIDRASDFALHEFLLLGPEANDRTYTIHQAPVAPVLLEPRWGLMEEQRHSTFYICTAMSERTAKLRFPDAQQNDGIRMAQSKA
jgi:hypothetical protein